MDSIIDYNHSFDFNLSHFKYEGFHLNSQAMFFRTSTFLLFSGFNIDLYNCMDYQLILEMASMYGTKYFYRLSFPLAAFRRYEGQKTCGINSRVRSEHILLSSLYNYKDKYTLRGKILFYLYRLRRLYWYFKRGGILLALVRLNRKTSPSSYYIV